KVDEAQGNEPAFIRPCCCGGRQKDACRMPKKEREDEEEVGITVEPKQPKIIEGGSSEVDECDRNGEEDRCQCILRYSPRDEIGKDRVKYPRRKWMMITCNGCNWKTFISTGTVSRNTFFE